MLKAHIKLIVSFYMIFGLIAAQATVPAAQSIDMQGKGCLAAGCHDTLRQRPFIHAPVGQGDCRVCHLATGQAAGDTTAPKIHEFKTLKPELSLCGRCHQNLSLDRASVHQPFRELCTACHDPHGGKVRYFLTSPSTGDLCLKCHAKMLENKAFIHAPVALKACPSCHLPHTSVNPKLLSRPPDKLCVFCHQNFSRDSAQAVSVHEPMRQACFLCHDPHGGNARGFLPVNQVDLCKRCHGEMLSRGEQAAYPHRAMVEHKQCTDCHDPHWAASTKLLKRPSMEICLQCHEESVKTPGGRELQAVGRLVTAPGAFPHGPIRQKDCTPCHAVHGSEDPRLMKLPFPKDFYAAYSPGAYALCFSCHNSQMVDQERSMATGFRNGDRNLHYVHVHQDKGRSCRACHQEHASQNPFHIRDWVPFGNWKLVIEYKSAPGGGTCLAGCHAPRGYNRDQPLDYTVPLKVAP